MSVALLLEQSERLIVAPEYIPSLKRLVLDLAVRGLLVERSEVDEPVDEQLHDIRSQSTSLVDNVPKRGRKRGLIPRPLISLEEVPFRVPRHWKLVRLGEVLNLFNGWAFKPSDWTHEGTPIIRIGNLNDHDAPFHYCNAEMPSKIHVNDGDLLICWSGTPGTSFGSAQSLVVS